MAGLIKFHWLLFPLEIPEDPELLDNYEKLISDVQVTISKLSAVKEEKEKAAQS